MDQGQSSGLVIGIQVFDQVDDFFGRGTRSNFEPDGISNPAEVFDVGTGEQSGAFPDPGHVGSHVVVADSTNTCAGQGGFVG